MIRSVVDDLLAQCISNPFLRHSGGTAISHAVNREKNDIIVGITPRGDLPPSSLSISKLQFTKKRYSWGFRPRLVLGGSFQAIVEILGSVQHRHMFDSYQGVCDPYTCPSI